MRTGAATIHQGQKGSQERGGGCLLEAESNQLQDLLGIGGEGNRREREVLVNTPKRSTWLRRGKKRQKKARNAVNKIQVARHRPERGGELNHCERLPPHMGKGVKDKVGQQISEGQEA